MESQIKKIFHISVKIFDTFSQGGGGGGGGVMKYELQTCSFTSIKLPWYVTVTIIIIPYSFRENDLNGLGHFLGNYKG